MDWLSGAYEGLANFAKANPFLAGLVIGLIVGAIVL